MGPVVEATAARHPFCSTNLLSTAAALMHTALDEYPSFAAGVKGRALIHKTSQSPCSVPEAENVQSRGDDECHRVASIYSGSLEMYPVTF